MMMFGAGGLRLASHARVNYPSPPFAATSTCSAAHFRARLDRLWRQYVCGVTEVSLLALSSAAGGWMRNATEPGRLQSTSGLVS